MANAIPGLTRGQLVAGLLFVVVITLLALCLRKTRKDGWSTGCVTMVCICSVLLVALPFVGFWRGRVLPEPVTRWQLALIALAAIVVLAVVWLLSSVGKTDNPVRCGLRRGATSPMKLFYFVLFVLFLAEVGYELVQAGPEVWSAFWSATDNPLDKGLFQSFVMGLMVLVLCHIFRVYVCVHLFENPLTDLYRTCIQPLAHGSRSHWELKVESVIRSAVIALASLKLCQGVWPVKLIDLSEHVSAFKAFALYLVLLYIALVLWDALLLCASKPKVNWKQTWIWVTGPSLLCWGLLFYFAPSGPILKVSDITDWHALGARLRADDGGKNAPATRYLWEQLGDSQEAVRRLADGEAPDQESRDKDAVVGALNHVLRKEHLWRVKGFAAIDPKLADNMRSQDARGDTDPRIRVTANYALVAALFRPVPGPASRKSPLVTAVCSFGGESLLGMGAFAGVLVVVLAISFLSDLKNLVRSLAKREPHLYKEFAAELLDLIRFGPYYGEGLAGVPGPHKLKDTPRGYDGTPCLQDTCRFQPILDTVYRLESSE